MFNSALLKTKRRIYGFILIPLLMTLWFSVYATSSQPKHVFDVYLLNALISSGVLGVLALFLRKEKNVKIFEILSTVIMVLYVLSWDVFDYLNQIIPLGHFYIDSFPLVILTSTIICLVLPDKWAFFIVMLFFSIHSGLELATQIGMTGHLANEELILSVLLKFSAVLVITLITTYNRVYLHSQYMAHTDSLTLVLNRRGISRYLQSCNQLSLMLIDIDDFKSINDHLGHDTGDKVLIQVAKLIRKVVDRHGQVGRWGGEEFIVVLPNQNIEDACVLAERIRSSVEHKMLHKTPVTVSIGVVQKKPDDELSFVLKKADEHMYFCKANGKNQVDCSCGG